MKHREACKSLALSQVNTIQTRDRFDAASSMEVTPIHSNVHRASASQTLLIVRADYACRIPEDIT